MPVTPDPQSNIDIGGLPTNEGSTGQPTNSGNPESGGNSPSSADGE